MALILQLIVLIGMYFIMGQSKQKNMYFKEQIDEFCNYLKYEKRFSDKTIVAYQKDLEQFFVFLNKENTYHLLNEVKHRDVRSWIVALSEDGVSNRSINRKISALRSFYKFIRKQHPQIPNPCALVKALKTPKRLPQTLKEQEIQHLRELIVKDESNYQQIRDYTIVELIYATGIRRSELVEMKLTDLDFSLKALRVIGKGSKERLIPISPTLEGILKTYLEIRSNFEELDTDYMFLSNKLNKIYPKAVYNIVKKYLSLITTIENRGPHALRHSFATHLTNRGAELNAVKALLGHASLAATQVYTHNSIEQLKSIYQQAHPKGN